MLKIENIVVKIEDKVILDKFSLFVGEGEIHAIMGPNGVGKSTLSKVIMGEESYKVVGGDILFNDKSILKMSVDMRSKEGIFLAMQYPTVINGVSNQDFLRTAMSAHNGKMVGLYDFIIKCEKAVNELNISKDMIHRNLNVGFSGGEKKKNEVLQIKLLQPKLIMLDEIDSGLDVDSLKVVCENILDYKRQNPMTSLLIITHYPHILEYLQPNYVHVMKQGKIVKTGTYDLALEILKNGYEEAFDIAKERENA